MCILLWDINIWMHPHIQTHTQTNTHTNKHTLTHNYINNTSNRILLNTQIIHLIDMCYFSGAQSPL